MTSERPGSATSRVEVDRIGNDRFTLCVDDEVITVRFDDFPWVRDASLEDLQAVSRPHPHHLRWDALDVDLTLDSLRHPELYPLVARG